MQGDLGVLLVIGGLAAVAFGALTKFKFGTEAKFELGDYKTGIEFDFGVDKIGEPKPKRRGSEQPHQIDVEKPMLMHDDIDMFPYYNRMILW